MQITARIANDLLNHLGIYKTRQNNNYKLEHANEI